LRIQICDSKIIRSGTPTLRLEPIGVVNTGDAGGPLTAAYDESFT